MKADIWLRYKKYLFENNDPFLRLDISRMNFPDGYLEEMTPRIRQALQEMAALEAGAIANADEGRMVGHYWLRAPERAPLPEMTADIKATITAVKDFAAQVRVGRITAPNGGRFSQLLVIGIGGSALGAQLLVHSLGSPTETIKPYFFDNTDPDGMDMVLRGIGAELARTLTIVISKSGGTVETRNGMIEASAAYSSQGVPFADCAVAITERGSLLDRQAQAEIWLMRFPLWDWVGGRTSITSPVGLLPAALLGIDIDALLWGAARADDLTRREEVTANPAALLALMWYHATGGCGKKDMIIIPYKDRLALFPRYLQQLVMESLGKRQDRNGKIVNQGISVFGNKGSTDQHSYVQQLRDGVDNFFVTFIEVLQDRLARSLEVEPGVTAGDYLHGFLHGTREALTEGERESLTITLARLDAGTLGILIALYERAVGLYAGLVNVNAYHQPGVEAGKKAAAAVIRLQQQVLTFLRAHREESFLPEEIAAALGAPEAVETIFHLLEHAAANVDHGIIRISGQPAFQSRYRSAGPG